MNRNSHTYRLSALLLIFAIMPGWYAMGASNCDMELSKHHQDDECCESGDTNSEESEYDLPSIGELNSESTEKSHEGSCDGEHKTAGHTDHKDSEGECNCCDTCEISSGTSQPSTVLDEALALDIYSVETHLYEKEILLSPDHHQVAELHNEPAQSFPPLYLMNQAFLN